MEFYIEFNPYILEIIFKKNGEEISRNSHLFEKSKERLQIILGEDKNWKGLISEIADECNSKSFKLIFKGRKIDFEDIEYSVSEYNRKERANIITKYIPAKNDNNIREDFEKFFDSLKETTLEKEAIEKVKNRNNENAFDVYKKQKENIFDINVVATMSSGKSTLINSILETELLPAKNEATTATIARILDNDDIKKFEVEAVSKDKEKLRLKDSIKETYKKQKEEIDIKEFITDYRKVANSLDLEALNNNENVREIHLEGDLPALSSKKVRLRINDTPGPNNSRTKDHGETTFDFIDEENTVVLYILNATQLEVEDDKKLLTEISQKMKEHGKQSHDRFIFVVNKADTLDEDKGELKNLNEKVRSYLAQFGIENPTIVPISARQSLLTRKSLNGEKLTKKEKSDYSGAAIMYVDAEDDRGYHFEEYATLTPSIKEKLKQELKESQEENDKEGEILIQAGIRGLEELLKEYIDKYAYPIKVKDFTDDLRGTLLNVIEKLRLEDYIASGEEKAQSLQNQVNQAKSEEQERRNVKITLINNIGELVKEFENDLNNSNKEITKTINIKKGYLQLKYSHGETEEKNIGIIEKEMKVGVVDLFNELYSEFYEGVKEKIERSTNDIQNEYDRNVRKITEKLDFGDVNIDNIKSISEFKTISISDSNYDDVIKTIEKKNPEREGWGWFKFWKPWKIEEEIVENKDILRKVLSNASMELENRISTIENEAKGTLEKFEKINVSNMDKLEKNIQKLLEEIQEKIDNREALVKEIDVIKARLEWYRSKEQEIKNILNF